MLDEFGRCEHTLQIKKHKTYTNGAVYSGCGNSGGNYKYKDWKVGTIGVCRYCGHESINVKERTVPRYEPWRYR